jgi:NADH-quinone oxidoreductase subunit L
VIWLLLVLLVTPYLGAVTVLFCGHRSEATTKGVAIAGSGIGLALAIAVAATHLGHAAQTAHVYAGTGTPAIELALRVDQLSAVMLLLANGVAFLVQVYSLGYLRDDPRYPSYAALVSLFTGAMTTVVMADDWWVLLVGWELMGACSYFLIAHHWERADARAGAVKAFLMTRLADVGLLFAILLLGNEFGSYRISTTMHQITVDALMRNDLVGPALLIVVAVAGKSAQFPFHTWLPDAMPGPTPSTALIHAATMVAAGVFLVARVYPLFLNSPAALTLLAAIAAVTMFLGALYALVSNDLKRVLAWSTVSQLAYMFGALAAGAYPAAVLHLLAHGAFKALLFLAAGSVVHAVGGSTSMDDMGGLRTRLPDTFATMTIGFGALAGVVPLVGFFTKDAAITGVVDEIRDGNLVWTWVSWLLLVSMVATAALTVAYSLRAWLLVFFGEPSTSSEAAREPPAVMRVPLVLLAIASVVGGLAVAYPGALLGPAYNTVLFHASTSILMTLLVVATAAFVLSRWRVRGRALWGSVRVPVPAVDRLYDAAIVRPVGWLTRGVVAGDRDVIDTYAQAAGALPKGIGWLVRRPQTGNVQTYLMVVVVGAAVLAVIAGVLA